MVAHHAVDEPALERQQLEGFAGARALGYRELLQLTGSRAAPIGPCGELGLTSRTQPAAGAKPLLRYLLRCEAPAVGMLALVALPADRLHVVAVPEALRRQVGGLDMVDVLGGDREARLGARRHNGSSRRIPARHVR